ncbi:MAG TPA: hypothetical protein VHR42_04505 [Clostridia bacterium]|nr:hypothetical protein [Clostridia bacterium]
MSKDDAEKNKLPDNELDRVAAGSGQLYDRNYGNCSCDKVKDDSTFYNYFYAIFNAYGYYHITTPVDCPDWSAIGTNPFHCCQNCKNLHGTGL